MAWDRNSAHYPRAVAQFDATACWAAGLEWWVRWIAQIRRVRDQLNLVNEFRAYWNTDEDSPEYGTVTGENLGHIMDSDSIKMAYVVKEAGTWDKPLVSQKLSLSPV